MIVKIEICLQKTTSKDIPQNCISLYFEALFQTQNDLKYEVFHDMFAPKSRINLDAEIENQKTDY